VSDQPSLAALLRGGALAPVAALSDRLTSIKALDSGAYVFVPPEAALDMPLLHDVTLAFDLMADGTTKPLTYRSISASHLDEKLRQVEALGLAETMEDALERRALICEFSELRSGRTYWLVPLARETHRSQARTSQCCCVAADTRPGRHTRGSHLERGHGL
jgi:hypothetical protein